MPGAAGRARAAARLRKPAVRVGRVAVQPRDRPRGPQEALRARRARQARAPRRRAAPHGRVGGTHLGERVRRVAPARRRRAAPGAADERRLERSQQRARVVERRQRVGRRAVCGQRRRVHERAPAVGVVGRRGGGRVAAGRGQRARQAARQALPAPRVLSRARSGPDAMRALAAEPRGFKRCTGAQLGPPRAHQHIVRVLGQRHAGGALLPAAGQRVGAARGRAVVDEQRRGAALLAQPLE